MPLVDQFGRALDIKPKRGYTRRPKNKPSPRRVSSKSVAAGTQALKVNAPVELMLAARHNIGDIQYGPGLVRVPRKIADVLQEGERRAAVNDANFAGTRAFMVGPGRAGLAVKEVAPEYFDSSLNSGVPFGVVQRDTAQFRAY